MTSLLFQNHTTSFLCEDLIVEIIIRLPPKSLLQFRCLSKTWCSRITSSDFIRNHALRSLKTPNKVIVRQRILCQRQNGVILISTMLYPEEKMYSGLKIKFPCSDFTIIGSCNGIICLKNEDGATILWNLSIGRKLTIPQTILWNLSIIYGNIAIGFGFDSIMNDYKIIGIPFLKQDGATTQKSFVYSMKTNSWSLIISPALLFSYVKVMTFPYIINGELHWLLKCESNKNDGKYHYCIMTFNLSTHVFGVIKLPEPSGVAVQLTNVKGSLAVISHQNNDKTWIIWVRRKFNNVESWSKAFDSTNTGNHCDFVSKNFYKDFEGYNLETGVRSRLVELSYSSFAIEMDTCVESLELLDKEIVLD
ncbi:F-box/kelch-repeat protein At3g06240-like [Rutidosis leptorrhynchoides]|uniref:F-box/kelch-repeat protein At3g06240-like n=1 Tax=Rutidosis leptorrhynchoides TaxID=125765 RepID=UPI003A99A2D4